MNELTCNSICQLLCCPPVPSKIAAKLAFMPPPASYQILTTDDNHYSFAFAAFLKDSFLHFLPDNVEVTKAKTRKGNTIAILYMRTNPNTKLTFLLSHGNAVDLGLMVNFMHELGIKLNVNVMCYDYSGYGASSGKPLEKNLYADAECALDVLRTKFSVPLEQIVLYGQSIGTVPTVHLATLHRVAAVVLHSPLMSGLRVAFPRLKRNYCCDVFSNLARAPQILSPTLVIHGTRDEVVHINHGYRICSALSEHVLLDPLFIDGAGHNDCEMFPQYLLRLSKLVTIEIPRLRAKCSLGGGSGGVASSSLNTQKSECTVHSTRSHSVSSGDETAGGGDTEVSPSSSHRLSQEFHKQSPSSSKRSTPSARRRISPLVVDNLRALLLKRPLLQKRNTTPLTVAANPPENVIGDRVTECNPSTLSHRKFSSENNMLSSHAMKAESEPKDLVPVVTSEVTPLITLNVEIEQEQDIQGSEQVNIEQCYRDSFSNNHNGPDNPPSEPEIPNGSDNTDELDHLILPPPPPPPPSVSLLTELPASPEELWSLHTAKGRKTFTLPQNFNPRRLLISDSNRQNTGTLPREFHHLNFNALEPSLSLPPDAASSNNSVQQSVSHSSTMSISSTSSSSSSSVCVTADPSDLPDSNRLEPDSSLTDTCC